MTFLNFNTPADYLNAAREMADSNRPTLARLLAEAAAELIPDPTEAARILAEFPAPTLREDR
ncbi:MULTISPECIES: hypothetical protein [unclassified Streptomyces]|uniref:hypothetical protein n=1 Tax=unclassified Streptomyces TaxID=2593676 RepID=UPI000DD637B7|nr:MULTISPECIES: hypothetical protein [unclassified Streptomyces]QZZ24910.1 hypothetical protein A7X85_34075 [Streptomyces sp. ST1015]